MRTIAHWRFTTPAIKLANCGSDFAKRKYGRTCAAESRSHIAAISPVITNTLPSGCGFNVVVKVLAKQAANIFGSCGNCESRLATSSTLRCMAKGKSFIMVPNVLIRAWHRDQLGVGALGWRLFVRRLIYQRMLDSTHLVRISGWHDHLPRLVQDSHGK